MPGLDEQPRWPAVLDQFAEWVTAQGGDVSLLGHAPALQEAPVMPTVGASRSDVSASIDAMEVGLTAVELGAGRARKGDARYGMRPRPGMCCSRSTRAVKPTLQGSESDSCRPMDGRRRRSRQRPCCTKSLNELNLGHACSVTKFGHSAWQLRDSSDSFAKAVTLKT